MLADRYVKSVLTVIALALVAIAAHLWQGQLRPAAVDAQPVAKYDIGIPKAFYANAVLRSLSETNPEGVVNDRFKMELAPGGTMEWIMLPCGPSAR